MRQQEPDELATSVTRTSDDRDIEHDDASSFSMCA
jgi:hypothetical protein